MVGPQTRIRVAAAELSAPRVGAVDKVVIRFRLAMTTPPGSPPSRDGRQVAPNSQSPLVSRAGTHVRKRERPRRVALKVRHKAMLAISLVIAALVSIMLVSVDSIQRRHLEEQVHPDLMEVGRAYLKLQETQFRLLQVIAQNLADAPRLRAALEAVLDQGASGPSPAADASPTAAASPAPTGLPAAAASPASPASPAPGVAPALGAGGEGVLAGDLSRQILEQLLEGLATSRADVVMITDKDCRPVARVRRTETAPICERLPTSAEIDRVDGKALFLRDPARSASTLSIAPGTLLACGESGDLAGLGVQRVHDGGPGTKLSFEVPSSDPNRAPPVCYWVLSDQVYQVCAAPLSVAGQGSDALGWFAIGFRLTDAQVQRIKGVLRLPVFVMNGDRVVAASEQAAATRRGVESSYPAVRWIPGPVSYVRTVGAHDTGTLDVDGQTYRVLRLPLGQTGPRMLALMSLNKALEPFILLRAQLFGVALWVMVIAMALSWMLGARIVRPIETMSDGMRRVADGDLKVQLAVATNDEIGDLGQTFNDMVQGLYEREHLSRMVSQSALGRVRQSSAGGDSYQVAKRIETTVLFSDVRDFTTMSEQLSPEEVVHLLNEHFEEVGRIIHRCNGDIDKFIGDAVMATFHSTPERDHAESAVLAAIEMQELAARRNVERRAAGKLPVEIGVGLNSGMVVQGSVGTEERIDLTVLGDVVNVASRLESFCKQGKYLRIVISEATYDRVRHLVDAELMNESRVKGKRDEVLMYEVRGRVA